MLSRPIASGAMLAVLLLAIGLAVLQPAEGVQSVDVEVSNVPSPATEAPGSQVTETASRPAEPADRVVDEAGFPAVPPVEEASAIPTGPVVTVNGRPLGQDAAAPEESRAANAPASRAEEDEDATDTETGEGATEVATVAEPPMPRPRPEDLPVKTASPGINYDEIAAAAYDEATDEEFMSREERSALAPLPGEPVYEGIPQDFDPRTEGLVEIVGPTGERIWVYEDQLQPGDSRVTFQDQAGNQNGLRYDDQVPLW